jgi:methyl-accepting chemotaxis protein WspA
LSGLQEKVSSSSTLIAFMGKVSDQASLLSLNSAIETSNIKSHKINFDKITQEIQRFAEKTAASTHEIEEIIEEINSSVVNVRLEANGCLQEINEGAQRLINVSNQLSSITNQGKEQLKKFENVNDVMQMQAIAAENIIYSITSLGETAQENTRSIHVLHENVGELGRTAAELQKTIGLFVS